MGREFGKEWMHVCVRLSPPEIVTDCESALHTKSLQSRPTLCSSMDCSPRGSSVHGVLQARILEWIAMPSSRGSSQPRDHYVSCIGKRVLYH